MNILITGATGAVGPSVVHSLVTAGNRTRVLSLDEPSAGLMPPDVEFLRGDVTDPKAVQSAMQGMEAVIHMAALLHIANPSAKLRQVYERVNIGGTRTIVKAALCSGAKRVVLFSTIAVYGPSHGQVLDEMSPTYPDTIYAQTKRAAEQIVLDAKGAEGNPLGTVLRLGAVYGGRIKGNYARLLSALERRRFVPVGDGLNRRSLIYNKDVGRAAALAVSHPAAAGRVYNVTDGRVHTLNEIIEAICSAIDRDPPRYALPVPPAKMLIGLVEKGSSILGLKSPVTQEIINKYVEDCAVDGKRIQNELGFVPQYGLQIGWRETIREMRK